MAIETKFLSFDTIGWERVSRNTQQFGWELNKAEKVTTTTTEEYYEGKIYDDRVEIKPKTSTSTSKRIDLIFTRDTSYLSNPKMVKSIEFIYNIICKIRTLFRYLMTIAIGIAILAVIGGVSTSDNSIYLVALFPVTFSIWFLLRLVENILAKIANRFV